MTLGKFFDPRVTNPALLPKVRSPSIMASANRMPCSLRIASFVGKRCADPETSVSCHTPGIGKSMGSKTSDLNVAHGCSVCHAILDGVDTEAAAYIAKNYPIAMAERLRLAVQETQGRLVAIGLITGPDWEIV